MRRKKKLPSGVIIPRSECPYGGHPALSWFFILTAVLNAALPIAERFGNSVLQCKTAAFPLFYAILAGTFLLECIELFVFTDSPSVKIAFSFCILSALCDTTYRICVIVLPNPLYSGAILTLAASMTLTAGFLILSICRDICREATCFSHAVAALLIPRTVFIGLTYLSAWEILQGNTVLWARLLRFSGIGTLFTGAVIWSIAAVVFFFLRTEVPNARYPVRLPYDSFPTSPPHQP